MAPDVSAKLKKVPVPVASPTIISVFQPPSDAPMRGTLQCDWGATAIPRSDAWRCGGTIPGSAGNIFDPCFEMPAKPGYVVCLVTPYASGNAVAAKLQAPLGEQHRNPPTIATDPASAWFVELSDGGVCQRFGGTSVLTTEGPLWWRCDTGEFVLTLQPGQPRWAVTVVTVQTGTGELFAPISSRRTVSVTRVWE